jgi:hypothetical protein
VYTIGHDPSSGHDGIESISQGVGSACAFYGDVRSKPTRFFQNAINYVVVVNEDEGIGESELLSEPDTRTRGSDKYHPARAEYSRDLTGDHPRRPRPEHHHGVAWVYATFGDCSPNFHVKNGSRFVGDGGGNGVYIFLRDHEDFLAAPVGGYAKFEAGGAKLAATPAAEETSPASDNLIDGDAVARLHSIDSGPGCYYHARNFMPENEGWLDGRKLSLNDMNVCPANAYRSRTNQHIAIGKMFRGCDSTVAKAIAPFPNKPFQAKHLREVEMGAP